MSVISNWRYYIGRAQFHYTLTLLQGLLVAHVDKECNTEHYLQGSALKSHPTPHFRWYSQWHSNSVACWHMVPTHGIRYRDGKSLCCIPETNVTLWVSYTQTHKGQQDGKKINLSCLKPLKSPRSLLQQHSKTESNKTRFLSNSTTSVQEKYCNVFWVHRRSIYAMLKPQREAKHLCMRWEKKVLL